jgi:hypothetical protein
LQAPSPGGQPRRGAEKHRFGGPARQLCLTPRFRKRAMFVREFSFNSSRCLNYRSNVPTIIGIIDRKIIPANTRKRTGDKRRTQEHTMARFEILDSNAAPLGEGPAAADMLFELGMMYSVGRDMPVDLISAHKWFNLAAMKGNLEAIRLRREIADQMSDGEIAMAQRAARDWLRGSAEPAMPAMPAIPAMAA